MGFIYDVDDPISIGPLIQLCPRRRGSEEEQTAEKHDGAHISFNHYMTSKGKRWFHPIDPPEATGHKAAISLQERMW
jgi:hypothetical protein